jgi:hypothetical protein
MIITSVKINSEKFRIKNHKAEIPRCVTATTSDFNSKQPTGFSILAIIDDRNFCFEYELKDSEDLVYLKNLAESLNELIIKLNKGSIT